MSGEQEPAAAASWLRERGVGTVALKLGPEGCYVSGEEFEGFLAAPKVQTDRRDGGGGRVRRRLPLRAAGGLAARALRRTRERSGRPGDDRRRGGRGNHQP